MGVRAADALAPVLSREPRILKQFQAEIRLQILEAGTDPDDGALGRELARKDGSRRFSKLVEERAQTFKEQPSLLSGATFETCLEQYKALIAHVEQRWADACQFYTLGNYPFTAFFSILVIEEVGKLARLAQEKIPQSRLYIDVQGGPRSDTKRSH